MCWFSVMNFDILLLEIYLYRKYVEKIYQFWYIDLSDSNFDILTLEIYLYRKCIEKIDEFLVYLF